MGAIQGVVIKPGNTGANTLGGGDGICGLLLGGVAVAGKIALGEVKQVFQVKDAEGLGLDAEYDIANNVRVFYHIKEFYRMTGNGTKLYIMLVPQSTTMEALVEDTGAVYAKKLIREAEGEIKVLAVGLNPEAGYTATYLNGLNTDVFNSIAKAQALAEWAIDKHRPLNVILEGRDYEGVSAAVQDLRDIENVTADFVSVVAGQDYLYADTLDAIGKNHAAIGTALGTCAKIKVNQNIGEVETLNLTDAGKDAFLNAGLSNHVPVRDVEDDWETLDTKGYIFPMKYEGADGFRWNNDHTCTPIVVDSDGNINIHRIQHGRTVAKAIRKLRARLLPKVKSVQPIDPNTGFLNSGVVAYFNGLGDEVFEEMQTAGEISDGKTVVDPQSNMKVTPKVLYVEFSLVNTVSIDEIQGTINQKVTL